MSGPYSIKQVFLHISNDVLRKYLEAVNAPLAVDWDNLEPREVEPLIEAWDQLPEQTRLAAERDFQDVWFLGTEKGIGSLVTTAEDIGESLGLDNKDNLSSVDKALWVRTCHPAVWEKIREFLPIDQLVNKRMWRHYRDLKIRPIKKPKEKCPALAAAIRMLIKKLDGPTRHCAAEHHRRPATGADYFAVYLDDGVDSSPSFGPDNRIHKGVRPKLATIAFVYLETEGVVRVYVERDAKVARALFEVFHEVMFGEKAPPDDTRQTAYQLTRVLAGDFRINANLPDGVTRAVVTQLRVRPRANFKRQITLKGNTRDGTPNDTFDMLDKLLHPTHLPRHTLLVDQMSLRLDLLPGRRDKRRTLSFDVCWPNGGNLHNQPEELQPLGERLLRNWGIDTEPVEPVDAWQSFLQVVDAGDSLIGRDTTDEWPNGLTQLLLAEGVLATATDASSAVCAWCQETHDVTPEQAEDGKFSYRTFCPELARVVYIERERVQRFTIHPSGLVKRLANALWIHSEPEEVVPDCVWRLGMTAFEEVERPVFFATAQGQSSVGHEAWPFEDGAIVVVPHQLWHFPALQHHGVQFVRADHVLNYDAEGLNTNLDSFFDDISVPKPDRKGGLKTWWFRQPDLLCVYGKEFTVDLKSQGQNLLRIASGRLSVPLTHLFQKNGRAVWKRRLSGSMGNEDQRHMVSVAINRLNKHLGEVVNKSGAHLSFELPANSEDLQVFIQAPCASPVTAAR